MQVTLIDKNTNGAETILRALSLCRDKQCTDKAIDHCLTAKPAPHLSALEFVWYCFLVEGVSIKTRLQQARHRQFTSMERSTRHIDVSNCEVVVPPTALLEDYYNEAYAEALGNYNYSLTGETLEDAAYILPMATTTKFVLAGNGRVWYEYLQKRLCKKYVQAEHYQLARELYNQLLKELPQFKYAHPCLTCGECGNE